MPKHKKLKSCIGRNLKLTFQIVEGSANQTSNNGRNFFMKRYGNIYQKICDIDNLRLAHQNARKDKALYVAVQMVDSNPDFYLKQIQDMLINKTYAVSEYSHQTIVDKGKERDLMKLPYYPDRIIQWAIMLQLEPIFCKVFTSFTCASLKNRGIHKASTLLTSYMKDVKGTQYTLKIDVRKFYPNINHEVLKRMLRKKFKDAELLELLDMIIDSYPGEKGVPIGSYLSQFLANFYLAYFDHWLKEKKGVKYVIRYMDDIVILHHSKSFLHKLRKDIDIYMKELLKLNIKENWQVFPTAIRGVDFVGYRHFYGYKLLRKTTCKHFKKKMLLIKKKVLNDIQITFNEWCSVNSYKGWLAWCNSFRLVQKYIVPIQKALDEYYQNFIKRKAVKSR